MCNNSGYYFISVTPIIIKDMYYQNFGIPITHSNSVIHNITDGKIFGENFRECLKMSGNFPTGKFPGKISGKFREIPGNSGKIPDGKISGETFGENSGKIYFLVHRIYKNP